MISNKLEDRPNIGKVLLEQLKQVGFETVSDLKEAGSENAFIRIRTIEPGACLNKLCALEGAVQGIRWHSLDVETKNELRAFFKTLNSTVAASH